jgi:hypothetical protein
MIAIQSITTYRECVCLETTSGLFIRSQRKGRTPQEQAADFEPLREVLSWSDQNRLQEALGITEMSA